eukprot:6173591-Pleurochrysis_carterae.AAC.9
MPPMLMPICRVLAQAVAITSQENSQVRPQPRYEFKLAFSKVAYSCYDVRPNCFMSMFTQNRASQVWIGKLEGGANGLFDPEKAKLTGDSVYDFPRNVNCDLQYCNIEVNLLCIGASSLAVRAFPRGVLFKSASSNCQTASNGSAMVEKARPRQQARTPPMLVWKGIFLAWTGPSGEHWPCDGVTTVACRYWRRSATR